MIGNPHILTNRDASFGKNSSAHECVRVLVFMHAWKELFTCFNAFPSAGMLSLMGRISLTTSLALTLWGSISLFELLTKVSFSKWWSTTRFSLSATLHEAFSSDDPFPDKEAAGSACFTSDTNNSSLFVSTSSETSSLLLVDAANFEFLSSDSSPAVCW